jgi:hypothetical protein
MPEPTTITATIQLYQLYGLWIQAGAIAASGIGVIITVLVNRAVARRRATIDLMLMEETNTGMMETRQKFINLREKGNLVQFAAKEYLASDETVIIRNILNRYELIAIGCCKHTIDRNIYWDWYRTTLVNDWIALKAFVHEYQRQQNPKLFCKFEALARQWATADERKHT